MKELRSKILEALISALPITLMVYVLSLPVSDVAGLVQPEVKGEAL